MEPVPVRRLSDLPVLVARATSAVCLTGDGEVETLSLAAAADRLRGEPVMVCHAKALAKRLGVERFPAFDLLELFAFVLPARFCLPTPRGLAEALGIAVPASLEDEAMVLLRAAHRLLGLLKDPVAEPRSDPVAIAWVMGRAGWPWAPFVLAALGACDGPADGRARAALQVYRRLPEWEAEPPEPPPGQSPVEPSEARKRLSEMVGVGGKGRAEPRPQQSDYSSAISAAFLPRMEPGAPNMVLAEAGTGVGKTLGYLAPASLWAEKNRGPVWISTYTRNLQHQIDAELDRLHTDPAVKARRVVLRKGRENYLCLLNFEEAVRSISMLPQSPYVVPLGLMARWVAATRDGDMQGGDFPGWLPDLVGRGATLALADRRGECVFSACDHFHKCFIEWSIRRARKADIVVANHALVMIQAALGGGDDTRLPTRYVFDEGHHVFDAADNAFAGHLTGRETAELRHWLLGAEEGRRSRARGLKRRIEDLVATDDEAGKLMEEIQMAARTLPGEGWAARVTSDAGDKAVIGPTERFLWVVRRQVYARAHGADSPYSLETEPRPPGEGLLEAAEALESALAKL
ncbi:MAG TPA: ATP-dependent DNA helicase, partial [Azospirillaceae bacterium]|nr:ATP-dependent DNA helicase [Azospirillaceae bacterium]